MVILFFPSSLLVIVFESCWQIVIAFTYKRGGKLVSCKYRDVKKKFWQVEFCNFIDGLKGTYTVYIISSFFVFWSKSHPSRTLLISCIELCKFCLHNNIFYSTF